MPDRSTRSAAGIALLSLLLFSGPEAHAQAGGPATLELSERDWPCHGVYREAFSAGAFWQGPPLVGALDAVRDAPEIKKLAESLAAPETSESEAGKLIADHAAAATESTRSRQLALLFAGLLEEANLYRRFILEGIVGMMGRRRIAAAALAQSRLELEDLAGDPSAEAKATREALEQRRFWQKRALDKADGDARFLCNRLIALEGRLGVLSRAIASHL